MENPFYPELSEAGNIEAQNLLDKLKENGKKALQVLLDDYMDTAYCELAPFIQMIRENHQDAFPNDHIDESERGMMLRDYFAAKAIQAIISNNQMCDCLSESIAKDLAISSYVVADAMLKQREL